MQFFTKVLFFSSIFIVLVFNVELTSAQSGSDDENRFKPALGLTGSYSSNSFKAWGTMENTRQAFLNLQFIHSDIDLNQYRLLISSELIVSGWIRFPDDGVNGPRESVYGIGLVPAKAYFPFIKKNTTPFFTTSAGIFVTNRAFPDFRGAKLNYVLEFGMGYQIELGSKRLLHVGYKLHHLSNGNRAVENPGIDSHMLFLGIFFMP